MRKTLKWLGATCAAGALIFGIATTASALSPSEASTSRVNEAGHPLPPIREHVERVSAPAAAKAAELALVAPMALPGGSRWQARPEGIFDRRALILPPGSTLSHADALALLGVSSIVDSTWPQNGGPAGRAMWNGSGWSGGAGAWALISSPQRYGQLYVVWQQ